MERTGSFARGWFVLLAVLALAACGGGGGSSGSSTSALTTPTPSAQAATSELANAFAATLDGIQEVPPRPTSASGSGTVVINPATRQMTATLTTTGIAGTDAQIRQGQPNEIGVTLFPMTESPRGSGIWSASAVLTDAQLNAFRSGGFYFNVASATFLEGEIRGQILAQTAATGSAASALGATAPATQVSNVISNATFLAALGATQQAPSASSAALGAGTLLVNPATRQFSAAITTAGLTGTSAQIQQAPPGAAGPVIVALAESAAGSGIWIAQGTLSEDQLAALQAGNTYFNVRSIAFPNGEIRGQILPQQVQLQVISGTLANTPAATTGTATTANGATPTTPAITTTGTGGTLPTIPALTGTGTGATVPSLTGTGVTATSPFVPSSTGTGTAGLSSPVPTLTGSGTTGLSPSVPTLTGSGTTGLTPTVPTLTGSGTTGLSPSVPTLTGSGTTGTGTSGSIGTTGNIGIIGTIGTGMFGTGLTDSTGTGTLTGF